MKAFIFIFSLALPVNLFAADKTLSVKTVQGNWVEVLIQEITEALKQDFDKNNLRGKNVRTVKESVVIDEPEIKVNGKWYPFVATAAYGVWTSNVCKMFGRTDQLNIVADLLGESGQVRVDKYGRFAEIQKQRGLKITTVTCTIQ